MKVISFDRNDCKKIGPYLDSYLSSELLVETNHEVLKHLEGCQSCSTEVEDRARIKARLARAVRADAAPAGLEQKIRREIRKTRARRPALLGWAIAAAATLVLAFASWGALRQQNSRPAASPPSSPVVAELDELNKQTAEVLKIGLHDHTHCAVEMWEGAHGSPIEIKLAELGEEFDDLVPLVEQKLARDDRLMVAHRCKVGGHEFVHLIVKGQRGVTSLAITKKDGLEFPRQKIAALVADSGIPIHRASMESMEIAGFETRDHLVFIVSNLTSEDNLYVASSLAPAVRDFLARLEA
jgi:hypothetical protein